MSDEIRRGNFSYANGVLRAEPGRMARIEGAKLRDMFLPKLSTDATKALSQNPNFVRSQLTHYGVEFEEKEFVGRGTTLLQKAIRGASAIKSLDPYLIFKMRCTVNGLKLVILGG